MGPTPQPLTSRMRRRRRQPVGIYGYRRNHLARPASAPITTPAFSTKSGDETALAFVATDYVSGPTGKRSRHGMSGGGLTWQLVRRTNVQSGTAEIWRAFAPAPLSNVTVTATLSQNVAASLRGHEL